MANGYDFNTVEFLMCRICLMEFNTLGRKPKVLHCGHTICEECTGKIKRAGTTAISCPVCRFFTSRPSAQQFNTNYQMMGFLAEKEKSDRERAERGEKTKVVDERIQFRMGRSKKLTVHVASKKDISNPELFVRKDSEGTTSIVIVGKTGSPQEIMDFIRDNGIELETGPLNTHIIYDEICKPQEKFTKTNAIAVGQSALACTKPPAKLENAVVTASYELMAGEQNGQLGLQLVAKGELPTGFQVFGGTMAKPSAKRLRELTAGSLTNDKNTPSTSAASTAPVAIAAAVPDAPVAKRTRRGRGK